MTSTQAQHATAFHALHTTERPLALANAWDVLSAKLVARAGAPAVATTSAGVAWALGKSDGDRLTRDEVVTATARIVAAADIPVSADVEGGYGDTPDAVAETVTELLAVGVVGINIEDGTRAPEEFTEFVVAAREAAERAGIHLFINARTDVFLGGSGSEEERIAEAVRRAARYAGAGASGIFVPGAVLPGTISALAMEIELPLNIMYRPGVPNVAELGRLGVSRLSLGSSVAEAAYGVAQRAAAELLASGTYHAVAEVADYGELNALLA